MKNLIFGILIMIIACHAGYAQCNEEMYELALAQVGKDVVLVRDFKVKLNEGNKRNPSPAKKFSVLMQKGITYRFSVTKDKLSAIEPILQLFDKNELLHSTFDARQKKSLDKFDYLCNYTGNYQVILSMSESKAGCAIGIMAMVTDSAFYAQGNQKTEDDKYILYAGVETPLNYITDQQEVGRVSITIDRGEIIEKDSAFYALVPTTGTAKITIKLFNRADSILEDTEQEFNVINLPEPKISLEGAEKEYINTTLIGSVLRLNITPHVYRVLEFYIGTELNVITGYKSINDYLTYDMINFLKSLPPNKRFYVNRIRIARPDGTEMITGPLIYYAR